MRPKDKDFEDFICYLDENNKTITIYVKLLDVNSAVRFLTKDGNIITLPLNRVLKIKQRGGGDGN